VQALDASLRKLNADYDTQRQNDFGLVSPRVQIVRPSTFAAWMASRDQLGGQHKIPRIITDAAVFENLMRFVASKTLIDTGAH